MTDKTYPYDPDLPYVVAGTVSGDTYARFRVRSHADLYVEGDDALEVIDTTPKPRVPDDARFITWTDEHGERHFAERHDHRWETDSWPFALEDLPGVTPETRFTVLDAREERKTPSELMDEQMRDDAARWEDGDDE